MRGKPQHERVLINSGTHTFDSCLLSYFLDPLLTQAPQGASLVLDVSEMYAAGTPSGCWPVPSALKQMVWHKLWLEI